MALFQKSVLNKYLREIDDNRIAELYSSYGSYFLNLEIQQNIRDSKEEQFQEGFLRELFVNVLGYTINPNPNYNLTTELKNETGAKKADGAILVGGKAIGVIELKSTSTKDLESIRQQAFDYKANQSECVYVVTSNFEKLRFYIDNAVDFEEFDLFTLSLEQFKLLYLCLHVDSIMAGIPKTAKIASLVKEENVTKKLYADYSVFKEKLFNSIISNDENIELAKKNDASTERLARPSSPRSDISDKEAKLILFKKTQKLMDRFLFIFFAEDRGLIPPNTISTILTEWEQLKTLNVYVPLYTRFKNHFDYINTGWKGDNYEVFAYNGGLFLPDEILDNITISDEVLYEQTTILTKYDFDSEVDVNILGHIFEHSLNEIETMNAELEGQQIDLKKTKRKKDGVFYTPKYITKYIVDNTIGKLCEEKKEELSIVEDDYLRGKKGRKKDTVKQLEKKLTDYRDWLLQITVVDPACGSGAFLNQALEFLIREHRWIDEMTAKLFGGGLVFQDVENSILENNLYGVDINEESVEIAKLSLWLRTAQKGRKLTSLNNNIKCGNSLIDDPEVAGDKAFKWEEEFPKVFAKGGFDIVIGNPPYLNLTSNNTNSDYLKYYLKLYISIRNANSKNLFTLFNELSCRIVQENGYVSFIIPEGFLTTRSYNDCVQFMKKSGSILSATYFEDWVFEDATTGSVVFLYKKAILNDTNITNFLMKKDNSLSLIIEEKNSVLDKYELSTNNSLDTYCDLFKGMAVKDRNDFISDNQEKNKDKFLLGNCISRYTIDNYYYCNYESLTIVGGTKKKEKHDKSPRILIRRTGDHLCCSLLNEPALTESTLYSCSIRESFINELDLKYILGLLNSKFLTFIVRQNMITNKQAFPQIMMTDIKLLKIPKLDIRDSKSINKCVETIIYHIYDFNKKAVEFTNLLQSKYEIDKLSKKLQNWYELEFKQFTAELKKKKVVLSLSDEAEWMSYFNEKKAEAQELKSKIDATDNEIDLMVYRLYDLTYDEVLIVDPETSISREVYEI
jgi:type I restriction-modification system DNA methylase subunit